MFLDLGWGCQGVDLAYLVHWGPPLLVLSLEYPLRAFAVEGPVPPKRRKEFVRRARLTLSVFQPELKAVPIVWSRHRETEIIFCHRPKGEVLFLRPSQPLCKGTITGGKAVLIHSSPDFSRLDTESQTRVSLEIMDRFSTERSRLAPFDDIQFAPED
jgi:hypothetical protein